MDPNGGINPTPPKLDNTQPPTDIFQQPQTFDQPTGASIPSEVPSAGPIMQDAFQPQMPPPVSQDVQGFGAPQAPQFQVPTQDPAAGYQQPMIDPDPMLNQPMMEMPQQQNSGNGKKIIFIALGALVVLGLLAGVGYAAYTAGVSAGKQKAAAEFQAQQAASQEQEATSTSSEDIKLDLSNTVDRNAVKEETVEGKVGEQVNSSDGMALYVTNIERNFKTDDASYQLEDGKELIKVNFIMGNFEKQAKDIKSSELYIEEGTSGVTVTPESRLTKYEGAFDTMKIDPGQQASGSVVYAVTKDITPLVFVRKQDYRISNQNKVVTTKTAITVAE